MTASSFDRAMAAAREGEPWAFARLYEDLKRPVLAYARLRGAREPDDVTSEVFLQVFRDLGRFQGGEQDFRAWVFTIAHRRVLDEWRSRSRRPVERPLDIAAEGVGGDTEAEALAVLGAADIRALLSELTPEQRDVVLLRVVADLPLEEVAAVMDRSVTALTSLQNRALSALRRRFGGDGVTATTASAISDTR